MVPLRYVQFLFLPLESIQSLSPGLQAAHRKHTHQTFSNQIKSNLFCHKFSTQYNNEFALHLAGQNGDNYALMSVAMSITYLWYR